MFPLKSESNLDLSKSGKICKLGRLTERSFIHREEHYRLKFSSCMLLGTIFCHVNKCKSNRHKYKDLQYSSSMREVDQYTNLNFIIKKIKELDYIKHVLFNREQMLSFEFFHKPLVAEKNTIVNRIINQIHYDLFDLPSEDKLGLVKEYYKNINPDNVDDYDEKILELIDLDFV